MVLSVIASTGEVVIVGVVLGADPSRCTYTLIGSPSGRIGAAVPDGGVIIPIIQPAAIWSVHPPPLLSPPWRAQAEGWIGRGGGTRSGERRGREEGRSRW